jgi:hypothetical protein
VRFYKTKRYRAGKPRKEKKKLYVEVLATVKVNAHSQWLGQLKSGSVKNLFSLQEKYLQMLTKKLRCI